jgi:thiamine-phosphate pyrophosphorylase
LTLAANAVTAPLNMRGLYAIVDVTTLRARAIDPVEFAAAVLVARPAALQLRAKGVAAREVLGLLRALGPLCHRAKVPLVANDRADLAALAGCDMVHVGQDDIGIDLVRRLAPALGVGVSTHTLAQLATALATKPRYVAFGPVYPTNSKEAPSPVVGIEQLREAHRAAVRASVPLVAIGGVTFERAAEVATASDATAVIAALVPDGPFDAREISSRAIELHRILSRERAPTVVGA